MLEEKLYDVYDGGNLVKVYTDEKVAKRRVYAENCSYRTEAGRTWTYKIRTKKKLEDA